MTNITAVTLVSDYDFQDTLTRLQNTFTQKGLTVFAIIDHQAAAQKAGLEMHPATVLIYGNPLIGTPLMMQNNLLALHLPLKVLVSQIDHLVQVSYTPSHIIAQQINTSQDISILDKAQQLIAVAIRNGSS